MTHTHSPWHLGKRAGNPAIYGKDGTEIAEILQGLTPEWRENARLIAAAPDLLQSLIEMCGALEDTNSGAFQTLADARSAIAKATSH